MEAEFMASSQDGRELLGLRQLFRELGIKIAEPMNFKMDNQAAIKQRESEKNTSTKLREVWEMIADLLTKALPAPRIAELRNMFSFKIMHNLFVTGHVRPHYPLKRANKAQDFLAHACSSRLTNREYDLLLVLPTSTRVQYTFNRVTTRRLSKNPSGTIVYFCYLRKVQQEQVLAFVPYDYHRIWFFIRL
uniref:AlNc14C44G3628 protein n=1 Tax=Albugo laibachii Nc14 TaxID=890382 RepID=F0WA99_9STRA|nr:AlNc14C44G3628 [Albugo laibachii Nc14]|eukprot:CCA18069.1 AlNc14C44G3628 [Albugo laibachii Nc14]